jgi:hypothetical protein
MARLTYGSASLAKKGHNTAPHLHHLCQLHGFDLKRLDDEYWYFMVWYGTDCQTVGTRTSLVA